MCVVYFLVSHHAGGEFLWGTLWQRSQIHRLNETLSWHRPQNSPRSIFVILIGLPLSSALNMSGWQLLQASQRVWARCGNLTCGISPVVFMMISRSSSGITSPSSALPVLVLRGWITPRLSASTQFTSSRRSLGNSAIDRLGSCNVRIASLVGSCIPSSASGVRGGAVNRSTAGSVSGYPARKAIARSVFLLFPLIVTRDIAATESDRARYKMTNLNGFRRRPGSRLREKTTTHFAV